MHAARPLQLPLRLPLLPRFPLDDPTSLRLTKSDQWDWQCPAPQYQVSSRAKARTGTVLTGRDLFREVVPVLHGLKTERFRGYFEHLDVFRNDFLSNAIAWNGRDPVLSGLHVAASQLPGTQPVRNGILFRN